MSDFSKNMEIINFSRKNITMESSVKYIKSTYGRCMEVDKSDNHCTLQVSKLNDDFQFYSIIDLYKENKSIYIEIKTGFNFSKKELDLFAKKISYINCNSSIVFGSIEESSENSEENDISIYLNSRMFCNDLDDIKNFIQESAKKTRIYINRLFKITNDHDEG